MENNSKIWRLKAKKNKRTVYCMTKKYEKRKIRVEHFPYFMKTKRSVGKRTEIMILVENEILLKWPVFKGGARGESQAYFYYVFLLHFIKSPIFLIV